MKFGEILNQKQLYSPLETEKSRRVTKSRPVCVGFKCHPGSLINFVFKLKFLILKSVYYNINIIKMTRV
jgi:hypothetical protein